jgi:hypothetical protein
MQNLGHPRRRQQHRQLPASVSATMGFRDSLISCHAESEACASTAPPPPEVVTGKPRAPVGKLATYFDELIFLLFFSRWHLDCRTLLTPQTSAQTPVSTVFSPFDHAACFSRVCVRVHILGLYRTVLYDVCNILDSHLPNDDLFCITV